MPSGRSSICTPIFLSSAAMEASRSDSFTRSSAASLMIVFPFPQAAATDMTGISSIALVITSPLIVIPFRPRCLTLISATGSPACSRAFSIVISAPISLRTSMMPVRVGFTPTFLIRRSEPGTIAAATMKNAADEISDGITTVPGDASACRPRMRTINPSSCISTPNDLSMRSV